MANSIDARWAQPLREPGLYDAEVGYNAVVRHLYELTGEVARRALGALSPQSGDSGVDFEHDTRSFHSSADSGLSYYSAISSAESEHFEAIQNTEAESDSDTVAEEVTLRESLPNVRVENNQRKTSDFFKECFRNAYYQWIHPLRRKYVYKSSEFRGDNREFFFNNLERIHANPYAFQVTAHGAIRRSTLLEKLVGLVKKVAHTILGFDQFAKITNAFLEKCEGPQQLLEQSFKHSETARDYEFLAKIWSTPGQMGKLAGNVADAILPTDEEVDTLKAHVYTLNEALQRAEAVQVQKEAVYNRLKSLPNPEQRADRIEAAEQELLEAAEEVLIVQNKIADYKAFFSNVKLSECPVHAALTERYYQDRALRSTGVFRLNGSDNDLPTLMHFVFENLENDEQWQKTLELILTQEAYGGFTHLAAVANGNYVEISRECDVIMRKENDEVVVTSEFEIDVKKDACLIRGRKLKAQKEYRFRKEGDTIQLIDWKQHLS